MDEDFNTRATAEVARLSLIWRDIEFWLKKAEQVNREAIIPAINELRYASRQMIVVGNKLRGGALSSIEERHVDKRLAVAEQYLLNAEHDIVDSITTYYWRFIEGLDNDIGATAVTELYPKYPLMKDKLVDCQRLIAETRFEYSQRARNYGKIKKDHLPFLIEEYQRLTDAEIRARHQKSKIEADLLRARAKIGILEKVVIAGAVAGVVALLSIPLSAYFWLVTREEHCAKFGRTPVLDFVCPARNVSRD